MNGFADFLFEALFQIRAGNTHGVQHLLNFNPFTGVVTDIVHRLNDRRIGERTVVGGAALYHAHRRDKLTLKR
ncbi:Uncharacterised protein [Klebsiella pneumoniae]|nr:Uncharacterised protein [Klebsiella pneumoniae]